MVALWVTTDLYLRETEIVTVAIFSTLYVFKFDVSKHKES